jgi:hypothetical protein
VVWGIYAPDCDEYAEITPEAIPLIGRPFILGSHDCWGLIMDWHATQGVMLNDFRVDYPWWESQYPDNLYFDNWEREGFIECDPMPGCMVIMQVESGKWNHAGSSPKKVNCSTTCTASHPASRPTRAVTSKTGR